MAEVSVSINGRSYQIVCDDGQESYLAELARMVDEKVRGLAGTVGQVGGTSLLVMTCLLLTDELTDLRKEIDRTRRETRELREAASKDEAALAERLETVAGRIDDIAARLEAA